MFFQKLFGSLMVVVSIEAFNEILEKNVYRFKPMVCDTEDCTIMANIILSAMNGTADPCEDFYEYACGAWTHSEDILPPSEVKWTRMAMYKKTISKKLDRILKSNNDDESSMQMARQWYRSCMDEEALESRGIEPLVSIVTAVGGWPIAMALGQWNPSDYLWQEIELYYSRLTGSYAMYDLVVSRTWDNASVNEISMKIPSLPLSHNIQVPRNVFDPEDREPYGKLIAGVAKAFAKVQGARVSDEKIAKETNDMIEFEMKLDKIRDSSAILTSNISLAQEFFNQQMPNTEISNISIWKLVKNLFVGFGKIEVTKEQTISIDVSYLVQLGFLLNETSFRTIVNYVHWRYLSDLLYTTNSEMRHFLLEFMKETVGISVALPRWEQCVNQMELKHALSYQFVMEYFTNDTYNEAFQMMSNIRTELERQINESTWMDSDMKELLIEKLWNVKTLIGFPDWYNNITNINEYYRGLTIDNDYFNNAINYMRFESKKMIQTLRDIDERPEWVADPITVNAFYIVDANSLNIPAADFQPPVFTPSMPDAIKYGILGSMLGHELSHGFDDTGFRFDKNGQLFDWPRDILKVYAEKVLCYIHEYDDVTVESTINKTDRVTITIGENMADTMGLLAVFNAYKSIVAESIKGDRKLPGLESLSNEQLFLLSFATTWCEISTPQADRKSLISTDPHSSQRIRVLATLRNTEGFGKAFHCSKGSPMNPEKKCNIWTGEPGT